MVLAVLGAGVVGAIARYSISLAFAKRQGFPVAVLVVNLIGCVISGVVLALAEYAKLDPSLRLIALTGLAGGITTFSTWSVESLQLLQARRAGMALANVVANLVLGFAAAAFAYLITLAALAR